MLSRSLLIATLALFSASGVVMAGGNGYPSHRSKARHYKASQRVESLAWRVEEATEDVIRAARRGRFFVGRDEARLLDRLYELDREARQFRRKAERHGYSPTRLGKSFAELERAYIRAARRLDICRHCRPPVVAQFNDVSRLMNRLRVAMDVAYEARYQRNRAYRRSARHHARSAVPRHYPRYDD